MDEGSVKLSAIVVTFNEERRLRECLESLEFCDETLVFDLGSTDRSWDIAQQCRASVVKHKWVPVVEQIWPEVVEKTKHSWVIRADPDEVFPLALVSQISHIVAEDPLVGAICIPHQYYFLSKPLTTTRWGNVHYVPKVFHRDRVSLRQEVHRGIIVQEGYKTITIHADSDNRVQHYWVDSYKQLFIKHWRYIKVEGRAKYRNGERFHWQSLLHDPFQALRQNLFALNGIQGGWTGIFLSFFYAWYVFMSLLSLQRYQQTTECDTR